MSLRGDTDRRERDEKRRGEREKEPQNEEKEEATEVTEGGRREEDNLNVTHEEDPRRLERDKK